MWYIFVQVKAMYIHFYLGLKENFIRRDLRLLSSIIYLVEFLFIFLFVCFVGSIPINKRRKIIPDGWKSATICMHKRSFSTSTSSRLTTCFGQSKLAISTANEIGPFSPNQSSFASLSSPINGPSGNCYQTCPKSNSL